MGLDTRDGGGTARTARSVVAVLAALLLVTACGSGAFSGPDSRSDRSSDRESSEATRGGSGSSSGEADGSDRPVTYTYSLPEGDTSHADENGVMYSFLSGGACSDAQAHLDDAWSWGFQSPEEVLMFQVGASMCGGDVATASAQFDRGESRYGWAGLATFGRNLCNIYRAYVSVRDQEPQDGIDCPGGRLVYWPGWPEPQPRDDPRTDAVEAASPDRPGEPYTEEPPAEPGPESTTTETSPPLPGEQGDPGETTAPEETPESTTTPAPDQAP